MSQRKRLTLFNATELRQAIEPAAAALPSTKVAAPPEPATTDEFLARIADLWRETQKQAIQIGRYLNRLRPLVPHGRFEDMVRERTGLQPSMIRKLRAVASMIDEGEIPGDLAARLETSPTILYEVATLTHEERSQALAANVIRPDMKRAELVEFKRRLRVSQAREQSARLEQLRQRRRQLLAELLDLRREMRALQGDTTA